MAGEVELYFNLGPVLAPTFLLFREHLAEHEEGLHLGNQLKSRTKLS